MPAWTKIWLFVNLEISSAKSVSRMTDSAFTVFSRVTRMLFAVVSKVLAWNAPSSPRTLEISSIAESMTANASCDLSAEVMSISFKLENRLPETA